MNFTTVDELMTDMTTEDPNYFSLNTTEDDYDYSAIPDLMCNRLEVREFRRVYEPPLYWIIALVGGAGNLVVVWIYLNFRQRLKTMTDVYLLNLAVADLLFLVTLPLWAAEATDGWTYGPALCKINSALYKVNLFSSMLLLTCISVDRYVVIVQTAKAHNAQAERLRCGWLTCVVVWLLALVLTVPELVFARPIVVDSQSYCRMVFPSQVGNRTKILVLSMQVSMGFCLPFIIMSFSYSVIIAKLLKTRNFRKHKAMRVILAVVVAFAVSQLPYNSMLVMEAMQATNLTTKDCEKLKTFDKVGQVLKSVAFMHACLNPFLYVFIGVRFRRDLQHLLHCYCCRHPVVKKSPVYKFSKSTRSSSTRMSVMSDSDTSQGLSL
ncbi:C-C chemokine receptor type 9a [Gouania willdenowi]|uniref:C-C chemokine receptor type 9a n=1 Tax=Gouania willdenowi TaxID=441366 RepID=UPI001054F7F8|nr:C-C chemokine receptor type 9-like [Gouania willdenowi]